MGSDPVWHSFENHRLINDLIACKESRSCRQKKCITFAIIVWRQTSVTVRGERHLFIFVEAEIDNGKWKWWWTYLVELECFDRSIAASGVYDRTRVQVRPPAFASNTTQACRGGIIVFPASLIVEPQRLTNPLIIHVAKLNLQSWIRCSSQEFRFDNWGIIRLFELHSTGWCFRLGNCTSSDLAECESWLTSGASHNAHWVVCLPHYASKRNVIWLTTTTSCRQQTLTSSIWSLEPPAPSITNLFLMMFFVIDRSLI